MRCTSPKQFRDTQGFSRCNSCHACRVTRREEWFTKLWLEYSHYKTAVFTTLTYEDDNLPDRDRFPGGNLHKSDLQKFFKRLRDHYKRVHGYDLDFRYYAVGEYGRRSQRAHFHVLFFVDGFSVTGLEAAIDKSWKLGFVYNKLLTSLSFDLFSRDASASDNIIAYVLKHNLKLNDHLSALPDGVNREFSTMSRRPPLGDHGLRKIASRLFSKGLFPVAGLPLYVRWLLETDDRFSGVLTTDWIGGFKSDTSGNIVIDFKNEYETNPSWLNLKSKYFRLDVASLLRLSRYVDSDLTDTLLNEHRVALDADYHRSCDMSFLEWRTVQIDTSVSEFDEYYLSDEWHRAHVLSDKSLRKLNSSKSRTKSV